MVCAERCVEWVTESARGMRGAGDYPQRARRQAWWYAPAPMQTLALLGALSFLVFVAGCGGGKGLPKGPAPEYEEDPVPDAGSPSAADGATSPPVGAYLGSPNERTESAPLP